MRLEVGGIGLNRRWGRQEDQEVGWKIRRKLGDGGKIQEVIEGEICVI